MKILNVFDLDQTILDTFVTYNNKKYRVCDLVEMGVVLSQICTSDKIKVELDEGIQLPLWNNFINDSSSIILSARNDEQIVTEWFRENNLHHQIYCVSDPKSSAISFVENIKLDMWIKMSPSIKKARVLQKLLTQYDIINFYDDNMENLVESQFICDTKLNCYFVANDRIEKI